ncbi:MAG: ABC transporter permease subunit [Clostridiales bacterium]|nr:ABC transporter permease subunit [Clostridiales bacterium]
MIIGVLSWIGYARLVYSSVLSVREKEYVESARAIGEKDSRILIKYILPNVISHLPSA